MKKWLKTVKRWITNSPKSWEEMTRRERAVALAQDVLAQIANKKFELRAGRGYVEPCDEYLVPNDQWDQAITPDDVCDLQTNCTVCARGALLLSKIDKYNNIKWEDLD